MGIKDIIPKSVKDFRYAWINEMQRKKDHKRNKIYIDGLLKKGESIKLEYGAGGRTMEGFTRVDRFDPAELLIDFVEDTMPFPDNSVDVIYTAHFLEHIRYPHPMKEVLKDAFRILKPGGILSVCVPDARLYIDAYMNPDNYKDPREICVWEPAYFYHSPIDYINYIGYLDNGEHKILFEPANLMSILSEAGFSDVSEREPDLNLDPDYHVNSAYDSIFVNATK
jgi:predicted SAM-dependent methyltransferase